MTPFSLSHKNMDFFDSQEQSKRGKKKRLREDQVRLLERSFHSSKKLEPERKLQLAEELGIPARQVAIWYQNKRARWRTQSLELDCGAMQLRLDAALAERRRLEREAARLRRELEDAKRMLFAWEHGKDGAVRWVSCSEQDDQEVNNNPSSSDVMNVRKMDDDQVFLFDLTSLLD